METIVQIQINKQFLGKFVLVWDKKEQKEGKKNHTMQILKLSIQANI